MERMEIRDPIYGFIPILTSLEKTVIDHPDFQRLRRIRQLGLASMVYPGCTHTRFEHSLGVMHLASQMYDSIMDNKKNLELIRESYSWFDDNAKKRVKELIRLAALLHDIGHTPFSHSGEEIMPEKKDGKSYKHEDYSVAIIKNRFKGCMEEDKHNKSTWKITSDEVASLIEGDISKIGELLFFKSLISSQLDADRGDYLLRDSYYAGVKYGVYDNLRILNSLTIGIDPEEKVPIIGVHKESWNAAESLILARYQMFTQVYFHKTRRAYDHHVTEAMKFILGGKFPSPQQLEEFLSYDDYFFLNKFKESECANKSEDCKAIRDRNHLREVFCENQEYFDSGDNKERFEKIKTKLKDNGIYFYEDNAMNEWYKMEEGAEIMLVENGNTIPLSEVTKLPKTLSTKAIVTRLYVKAEDKKKAKEII